jgi:hypothetical protein
VSGASAIAGILLLLLIAAPVAFYYLKIVPDLRRAEAAQFPERAEMRDRAKLLATILDCSRVISFDCEGFENVADYERLARKLLAAAAPPTAIDFTCKVAGDRKRLEVRVGSETFARHVEDRTDWVDLEALLPLLNRALRAAGAKGKLTTIELTSDQGAHVVYASEDERARLRKAGLRDRF